VKDEHALSQERGNEKEIGAPLVIFIGRIGTGANLVCHRGAILTRMTGHHHLADGEADFVPRVRPAVLRLMETAPATTRVPPIRKRARYRRSRNSRRPDAVRMRWAAQRRRTVALGRCSAHASVPIWRNPELVGWELSAKDLPIIKWKLNGNRLRRHSQREAQIARNNIFDCFKGKSH